MIKRPVTCSFLSLPFLTIIFLFFCCLGCTNNKPVDNTTSTNVDNNQRQDLLTLNEKPLDEYTYHIEWGQLKVPLEKYANPNVHKGVIKVELEDLLRALPEKIRILKGDKVLEVEVLHVSRPRRMSKEQLWFDFPITKKGQLSADLISSLREKLQTGDELYLRLEAEAEKLQIQPVLFQIGEPAKRSWTPGWRKGIQKGGEVYGFQIINEEGRQPVLRIDTTSEKTKHILSLYQDNKQYKIIHIPGFKTRKRLVTERESLFPNKEIQLTNYLGFDFDLFTLSDYTDYIGKKVELHWGDLIANPESENYSVAKFQTQLQNQPQLWIGNVRYPVAGFHLLIVGEQNKPQRYIASRIDTLALQKVLFKLPPNTSVYFEHVIIEQEGQHFHFPGTFGFHLTAKEAFDLQIEPAGQAQEPKQVMDTIGEKTRLVFQAIDLKTIISELMNLPEGKLRFANFVDNPVLNISFQSSELELNAGKDLIAKRLSSLFKLNIESHVPRPTYNLKIADRQRLASFLIEEKPAGEPLKSEEHNGQKIARFRHVTTETLSRFIDSELDLLIINDTQLKDQAFRLELNYTSLAEVKQSLERIGLELEKNPIYVRVVVTRLY